MQRLHEIEHEGLARLVVGERNVQALLETSARSVVDLFGQVRGADHQHAITRVVRETVLQFERLR